MNLILCAIMNPFDWRFVNTTTNRLTICAVLTVFLSGQSNGQEDAETARLATGKAIYIAKCASCHGDNGQGVADFYPDPLVGDSSIGELAEAISETMPEEKPEECVGEQAAAVATYIHHAFYSEAARIRNRPPRIGLARLTSTQLRQSLADLYAHFEGFSTVTNERGVSGEYYHGSSQKKENRKIDRVDPVIDFDFGNDGPGSDINPKDFLIDWDGAIKVDVTGEYEIVVHSTCSLVMKFGANDRVLIDNHVQSGDKTEFRRNVMLTSGGIYPFEIKFEQRKRKTKQPPAKVKLSWIPPGGVQQVIPNRNLIPGRAPSTFSLQTKLPPDDRSYGYERGINIDPQWDESTTAAALEFAEVTVDELWPQYERRNRNVPEQNRKRLRAFLSEFVNTALRGSLDDQTQKIYIDKQLAATADDAEAIKRVVFITLKSPRFLYPLADSDQSQPQRVANRLALTMFDSLPADKWLLDRIQKDQLKSEQQIRSAANRMLDDWRTRAKTRSLMHEWLNLSHIHDMSKDQKKFPGFDEALVSDLRASMDATLEEIIWSESSDYRQLFLADWTFTTDRLAAFYGDHWQGANKDKQGLRKTVASPEKHLGVFTHPLMMSGLAYNSETSPIHRGVFLIRYVLGRTLRPPNDAFTPISPDLHPELTTRERVKLQTSPESCQICHSKINSLGFALENYDAVGKFQSKERGKTIDATGSYIQQTGEKVEFKGARDLARYLADSKDARLAFIDRSFQHFVKQPVAAYGPETMNQLMKSFTDSGYNVKKLLVEIVVIAASKTDGVGEAGNTEKG